MSHLILDGADVYEWPRHHGGGVVIPAHRRPTVPQANRLAAEAEVMRLAAAHPGGVFVLFAPVAIAKRVPEATHCNLRGEVMRTHNVVRLLPIVDAPYEDDLPF
ncbi:MAG: hypothetical protein IAE86_22675 [Burkholderiaceae bacterium]|nr:hypothetical protein [Burkholderiaceae bacterium]